MKNKKLTNEIEINTTIDNGKPIPKIIIFEGPDGCGKTAISRAFVNRHVEYSRFKLKKEKLHILQELTPEQVQLIHEDEAKFLLSFVKQVTLNVVFDRNFPSEICYGNLFRHINKKFWKTIDLEHSKIGTKIIYLTKKDSLLKDDIFKHSQLIQVKKEYEKFLTTTKCDVLVLDTGDCNLEKQLNSIDNFIYNFSK